MTEAELLDKLDGLKAYDSGATDSGIKDDAFKAEVVQRDDINVLLRKLLLRYLGNDARTIEDAKSFLEWVEDDWGLGLHI